MTHPEPFHIFKTNIFNGVHAAVPAITMEWLDKHIDRLCLYWKCGEPSVTATNTILAFAQAEFSKTCIKEKTPLQLAKSFHRRYVMFTITTITGTRITDAWSGKLQHFGKSVFTVVGTCGNDPVIVVHRSENHVQAEQCVISWKTGKIKRFIGTPNPLDTED